MSSRVRIALLVVLFCCDRLLKNFIWFSFPRDDSQSFIYPVLNRDISFSLHVPAGIADALTPVLVVIVLFLLFQTIMLARKHDMLFFWWGIITVGALSNVLDRITLGGVLDYINLPIWPVFNISDACITVGIVMLLLRELFFKTKPTIGSSR